MHNYFCDHCGAALDPGEICDCKQQPEESERRIVTYAREGKKCRVNEQLGFIKFGSRVDLYFPLDTEVFVQVGDNTTGNETIIARLNE